MLKIILHKCREKDYYLKLTSISIHSFKQKEILNNIHKIV